MKTAQEKFEELAMEDFESNQEIYETEVKVQTTYDILRVALPMELWSVLAHLDGVYGDRQFQWQQKMYLDGFKAGLEAR
ncbi:hypothetical protein [Pelosinus propionicus]|uniref:Uncharacterized protein n=1 Tax=Pelosinus propionicus DSM 13327 TaxID=1123291 RepID=A0A1I4JHE2_9FIRM|nr:hypothetical protein [Pelosinus propionicus]SFL65546.1 hypothetical protein SAMN04490355_101264 [Pelosinus propionicus DSM 13327]